MILIILMLATGVAIALAVMVGIAAIERSAEPIPIATSAPDRNRIGASVLFQLLLAGGSQPDEALSELRRVGVVAPVTAGIDIASWSERYAHAAPEEQRTWLLETAVKLIAAPARPVPLRQYAALLDLSFSLGFQTDALAKLREQYGFDYIDHAKDARPREADRGGGAMPLFVRGATDTTSLLKILGLEGHADRHAIIAAYRRLAAQHHPDKVYSQSAEVQSDAAARFIEITRAYEALMAIYRD
ncbi:MAG TPA: J domain-containing protein [Thermoanaerobaculia bacterium]|nr:J domain-containing protein [Thermoanaerobaculia bacterium]